MKPKQFFFIVLGILVAVAGAGGVGYYYAQQYVASKSLDLSTRLAEQKAAEEQIEKLNKLQFQYDRDVVPLLDLINNTLPREKKQSEVLAQIQRIAKGAGLGMDGVTVPSATGLPSGVSQTVKAGKVLAMPINFKVSGTYAQLRDFTTKLENLNRFTNVTSLAVHRDGPGTAAYTYTVNAYVKP